MQSNITIGLLKKSSGDYIAIVFPYSAELVKRVKALDDRRYDSVNRRWIVSLNLLDKVKSLFPDANYTEGIKQVELKEQIKANVNRENFFETIDGIELSKPLDNGMTLFKHQQESVLRLLKYNRQILALDMGLGKTVTSLVTAKLLQIKHNWDIVVICPVTLVDGWKNDAYSLRIKNITFYSWSKIPKPLLHNYILIADEAHYAQAGSKSQRGKAFLDLAKSSFCMSCMCLTGTPMKNGRPINLLPLLEAIRHPLSKDKRFYQVHFCDAHASNFSRWDVNGVKNLQELHEKTKDGIIRRTKKECIDLPEKMRIFRTAELSPAAEKLYNDTLEELKERYLLKVANGDIVGGNEALVMLGYLRMAGSIAKTETAKDIIYEILEENRPVVVFSYFTKPLETLYNELIKRGIKTELLLGSVPAQERQPMVDRFQKGLSKVFLLSMAGGVGINLFTADTIILIDRPWTPGDVLQIEDRLHRIGQKNSVSAIWLQYGEVDSKVDSILQDKNLNITEVLEGKRMSLTNDSAKQILTDIFK